MVRRNAAVAHANAAGVSLLEHRRSETRARLKDAIAGHDPWSFVSRFDVSGADDYFLIVLRDGGTILDARLAVAARRWCAGPREIAVVRWLVSGDSNKEIAVKLGCSEVGVERRVTQLLRKARCNGRSRLIAAFWTGS